MSEIKDAEAEVLKLDGLNAVLARLSALEERTGHLAQEAQGIAGEVRSLTEEVLLLIEPGSSSEIKRPNGRLTDAGIKAINDAYANGMTVTQVAKTFRISPSAASNRRSLWLASTNRSP